MSSSRIPRAKSSRSTPAMSGHTRPWPRWAGSMSTLSRLARPATQAGPATANPTRVDPSQVVIPRGDGETWLECERGPLADEVLERVVPQVGQVRDDEIDRLGDRCEEVALAELDPVRHAVSQRVLARDDKCIVTDVRRDHVD